MSRIAIWLTGATAVAAVALFFAPAHADEPKLPTLDSAMRKAAPDILKELHKRGYKNVGVLKFGVAEGKGQPRANVGSLNRTLADRLEVALTLGLDDDNEMGIIAGATDAAMTKPKADLNDNRAELFKIPDNKFSVPWKLNQKIHPDAFLTGTARISDDRLTLAVQVQVFDRANPMKLDTLAEFKAANDFRTLTETGLTYAIPANARGAPIDKALAMNTKATATTTDSGDDLKVKAENQLADLNASPVELQILYDGVAQKPTSDPGATYTTNVLLRVPPPGEKTKVTFRLTNRSNETCGVVLRINGRNTIYEQRDDPMSCYKWILKKDESVLIKGIQKDEKKAVPIKVTPPDQLSANEFSFGDNPGTIDLIVFRAATKAESATVKADDPEESAVAAISRGAMLTREEPPASNLRSFQAQLRREGASGVNAGRKGGVLLPDPDAPLEKNPVEVVKFTPDPAPAVSVTLRYYTLKK